MKIFLTGGTGFVGRFLVRRLVKLSRYEDIYLLVRPSRGKSAEARLDELVQKVFPPGEIQRAKTKLKAVAGDLTDEGLGLSPEDRAMLVNNLDQIVHVGASTDFGAPLEESRKYNVDGTRYTLDLALECRTNGKLERYDYVSTAYVAGTRAGEVTEDDYDRGQTFANNYEKTKFEAEGLVRTYMSQIPIAIYRPSIIVGDSRTGFTPHFKVLYWPLQLLSKNMIPFVPCDPKVHLDVVPADYVADGIIALMQRENSIGRTYHLTAGKGNEITIKTLLTDAFKSGTIQKKPVIYPWVFRLVRATPLRKFYDRKVWDTLSMASTYSEYVFGTGVVFNSHKTHTELVKMGVHAPRWQQYNKRIFGYCLASKWGRRLPQPEHTYYL